MSLKVHTRKPVEPNVAEELQALAFAVVRDRIKDLNDRAWKCDIAGREKGALHHYKGAWNYHLLIHYAYNIRQKLDRLGLEPNGCNAGVVEEEFKIDCVEENLHCLSKTYDTDYVTAWKEIAEIYGIDRQTEQCDTCCVGISEMIIDYEDECFAFIVGPEPCGASPETPQPPYGEFAPCEFVVDEVVEPVTGDNDIYEDCDN